MIELNVSTLSGGALVERIQDEISKAIANITDPNTPAKKARTVTMKMTIKPNEQRNMAEVSVSTSSTLCAPTPIETGIYIGMNPKTGGNRRVRNDQRRRPHAACFSRCGIGHSGQDHALPRRKNRQCRELTTT